MSPGPHFTPSIYVYDVAAYDLELAPTGWEVSEQSLISCRLVHREVPTDGLAGAVTEGIAVAHGDHTRHTMGAEV